MSYAVLHMHRRKDLWGETGQWTSSLNPPLRVSLSPAHEFDPNRFLDERLKTYLTPNPFIFLPFNAGPRICLGQQVRHIRHALLMTCMNSLPVRLQRSIILPYATPSIVRLYIA